VNLRDLSWFALYIYKKSTASGPWFAHCLLVQRCYAKRLPYLFEHYRDQTATGVKKKASSSPRTHHPCSNYPSTHQPPRLAPKRTSSEPHYPTNVPVKGHDDDDDDDMPRNYGSIFLTVGIVLLSFSGPRSQLSNPRRTGCTTKWGRWWRGSSARGQR
jgi:hypothetical protein